MVRLKREGRDGNYAARQVIATFWFDVEERIKVLGVSLVAIAIDHVM